MRNKYDLKPLALISQIGIGMITPILLCILIGNWLDKKFAKDGLFFVIFLVLGVLASFRNLFSITSKFTRKK